MKATSVNHFLCVCVCVCRWTGLRKTTCLRKTICKPETTLLQHDILFLYKLFVILDKIFGFGNQIHKEKTIQKYKKDIFREYQPSGEEGTRSPPATPHRMQRHTACNTAPPATLHRMQNPVWLPGGPKMVDRIWKGFWAF